MSNGSVFSRNEGGFAGVLDDHVVAFTFEAFLEGAGDLVFVLDDEHPRQVPDRASWRQTGTWDRLHRRQASVQLACSVSSSVMLAGG